MDYFREVCLRVAGYAAVNTSLSGEGLAYKDYDFGADLEAAIVRHLRPHLRYNARVVLSEDRGFICTVLLLVD